MTDDIRKAPLAAALRAVVEEAIAASDLDALSTFADVVYDRVTPIDGQITPLQLALYYAVRDARRHVADDKRTAGRIEEARKQREGESEAEYRARMEAFGLEPFEPEPPFRVMTPQEQSDFMSIVASIQRRTGESLEAWQARYKRFEETGETDLPDDVRERLRQPGESVESYLARLKAREVGDD